MTYFPSCLTTEGLNVPADSNPSPRGDKIGPGESRAHFPKRGVNGTAATAARAMRTSVVTADARAARVAKEETLTIPEIPFLTSELDTTETSGKFLLCDKRQTINRSEFGQQLNERPSRDLQRLADGLAIYTQTSGSLSCRRNSDRCSSGNGRWVVQDEIQ